MLTCVRVYAQNIQDVIMHLITIMSDLHSIPRLTDNESNSLCEKIQPRYNDAGCSLIINVERN